MMNSTNGDNSAHFERPLRRICLKNLHRPGRSLRKVGMIVALSVSESFPSIPMSESCGGLQTKSLLDH